MNEWNWAGDGTVMLVGLLSACACALPGNYLVLRKMSLMGDAISHAVLPGLAVAFLVSHSREAVPMFIGAVAAGGLTALLTQAVHRFGKVEEGAAMGVIFSILFAAGLILIRQATDHVDLDPGCVLYGNIENIALVARIGETPAAVINLAIVFVLNVLFVALFYKELKICAFDPALATTLGINANVMHYALMIIVAVTTVASFEAVGSILVIAMLIVPPVTAHLLTDRLWVMIPLSLLIAAATAVLGRVLVVFGPVWAGVEVSANTAALMAVLAGLFLFVALFFAPEHGLISRSYHRLALSLQIIREDILGLLYRWQELDVRRTRPAHRDDVLTAVGNTLISRWALRSLLRRRQVQIEPPTKPGDEPQFRLSEKGLSAASRLVRAHRLWEAYLEKHFNLPLDHLHMPAERVEHYITPQMRDDLEADLVEPSRDPHGREIPEEDRP
ncbi:MAG: metal ABC transporter permease [Phycisphaerales bacterium]|nr:metal ABC transporter permease [Phycisphaerales bacterium]